MEDNRNIDKIFSKEAMKFSPKAPDGAWSRLNKDLDLKRKRNRRRFLIWPLSVFVLVSCIIVISLKTGLFKQSKTVKGLYNADTTKKPVITNDETLYVESAIPDEQSDDKPLSAEDDSYSFTTDFPDYNISQNVPENIPETPESDNNKPGSADKVQDSLMSDTQNISPVINDSSGVTTDLQTNHFDTIIDKNSLDSLSLSDTDTQKSNKGIKLENDSTEELITDSIPLINNDSVLPDSFLTGTDPKQFVDYYQFPLSVSFYSGLVWSYRNSTMSADVNNTFGSSRDEKPMYSLSSNLYVQYRISNRFSAITGISLYEIGHTGTFSTGNHNLYYVNLQNFGYTSAGFYSMTKIEELLNKTGYSSINCLDKFDKVTFSLSITEIPLMVKYTHKYRRYSLCLSAGVNEAIISRNRIFVEERGKLYELGTTENIRKSLFGFSGALDINYQLNNRFSVFAQPQFKYFITSVSKSNNFVYRPYVFSLNLGIWYKL